MAKRQEIQTIARSETLTDRTTKALRQKMLAGDLKPGQQLPPSVELSRTFGVSLSVVREALSRLKHDGVIDTVQGAGCFVTRQEQHRAFRLDGFINIPTPSLVQVYEMREAIEGAAAGHAARHRTAADLKILRKSLSQLDRAVGKQGPAIEVDHEFHRAIVAASGNLLLLEFWNFLAHNIRGTIAAARSICAGIEGLSEVCQEEHRILFRAIDERDPAAATQAAINHVRQAALRIDVKPR